MKIIQKSGFIKLVAIIMIFVVMFSLTGVFGLFSVAQATAVTGFRNTLSDSDLSMPANHTIRFITPSGVAVGQNIIITFAPGFTIPGALDHTDIDVIAGGTELNLAATAAGGTWGISVAAPTITLTSATGTIATSTIVIFEIGTHATHQVAGDQRIINPGAVGSYTINISGTFGNTGQARIAIVDDVVVTATVDASLTFTISGVASGTAVKGATTTISSTTTTIPFGTLAVGASVIAAQTLSVSTNAADGFTVTLEQDQNLTSAAGSDIDCFNNGVCATTTAAYAIWSSPTAIMAQEATYGHFGFTSEDNTLGTNCAVNDFGANLWGGLLGASFDEVMCHIGPADGITEDMGRVRVGFRIEISALQEAGNYTNSLTYIATPTY